MARKEPEIEICFVILNEHRMSFHTRRENFERFVRRQHNRITKAMQVIDIKDHGNMRLVTYEDRGEDGGLAHSVYATKMAINEKSELITKMHESGNFLDRFAKLDETIREELQDDIVIGVALIVGTRHQVNPFDGTYISEPRIVLGHGGAKFTDKFAKEFDIAWWPAPDERA